MTPHNLYDTGCYTDKFFFITAHKFTNRQK